MPAKSKSEQRLFGAAEHGADFPLAEKLRESMTHDQLHDFASGSEAGKPERVRKPEHFAATRGEHHSHLNRIMTEQVGKGTR